MIMANVISFFVSLCCAISLFFQGVPYCFKPTLAIDVSSTQGEVYSYASGFLYGLAEENVPDSVMAESIDISSSSQKVINGLQHPVGDIDSVSDNLSNADYLVTYLQDYYDTWYYCYDEITALREAGEYDAAEFVEENFLPSVIENVTTLSQTDYSDRIVYCPFNECDNTVWFGTAEDDGTWYSFDEEGFFAAWKVVYDTIKSIDPDALIGGPGYCDYDADEIESFLSFCVENDCVPDVMIYHELYDTSSLYWEDHVAEYREIEESLGLDELVIIVTEYGTMQECSNPVDMLYYIVAMENTKTYGNVAFWRLADNLCDTSSDGVSPNSNWWLYRWYADMEGQLLESETVDPLHSDFANTIKYRRTSFHFKSITGLASMTDDEEEIDIIAGGADYTSYVTLKNLKKTSFYGETVIVTVECVYFEGVTGVVTEPITVSQYTTTIKSNKLTIELENIDETAVYHITITKTDSSETINYTNDNLPVRYEFENGTLLGTAYTYDSSYATTGETSGMVGGIENEGDGVALDFTVDEDGWYDLKLIYGKSNDGSSTDDRVDGVANMDIDGEAQVLYLSNTIKSEYTDSYTVSVYLTAGTHTITMTHNDGTYVLDSMLVSKTSDSTAVSVLADSDRTTDTVTSFLIVAPEDGYYEITSSVAASATIGDASLTLSEGTNIVYLRRGLSYIDITSSDCEITVNTTEEEYSVITVTPADMTLSDAAELVDDEYIYGITSDGGQATFTVTADEAGWYGLTLTYSNNLEGGVHSYNVDLLESYVTVSVNDGDTVNLWCRNTYSWETQKTATIYVYLEAGENTVTFTNEGSSIFNDTADSAPRIYAVTFSPVTQ